MPSFQQSLSLFDAPEASAGLPASPTPPPKEWAAAAMERCLPTTARKALTDSQIARLQEAMWGYAQARAHACAAPLLAREADAALRGWVNVAPVAAHVRVLCEHRVELAEVPTCP